VPKWMAAMKIADHVKERLYKLAQRGLLNLMS